MRRALILMAVAIAFFVAGCAPSTLSGIKKKPAGIIAFEYSQPYEIAYRKAAIFAKRYEASYNGPDMVVFSELYHDLKKGEIYIALHTLGTQSIYLAADIDAEDDDRCFVKIYYGLSTWERNALKMKDAICSNGTD